MRSDDMLRLVVTCAKLAVQGQAYRERLADGILRILDHDAGSGIVHWDMNNGRISDKSTVTVAGTRPLTKAAAAASFDVIPQHPLLSRSDFATSGTTRVSDVTFLPDFWGQPAWYFVHGIHHGGLYPAVVNLGFHREWAVFAGVQRLRRDLSDEEMEVLDTIREPLTSAIAFRSELDRAVRRLQRMRVDDEPPKPANCSAEAALPERTNRTVSGLQSRRPARPPIRVPPVPDEPMAFIAAPLTDREAEVLALVAAGWTSHKVGRVLAISERTVRKHLGNVYEKLGVSGRTSAAAWWLTHGVGKV